MSDPIQTPFPRPGDVDYRDHIALALSRLPQQFRQERLDPPTRPVLIEAISCGVTIDPDTSVQVVTMRRSQGALEDDSLVMMVVSDSIDGRPDPLVLPSDWVQLGQFVTPNDQVITILRRLVGRPEHEPESHSIFLVGGFGDVQAAVLVYRFLDPTTPLLSVSAVDVTSSPLFGPSPFACPAQQISRPGDLYVGVCLALLNGTDDTVFPANSTHLLTSVQNSAGFSPTNMVVFDTAPEVLGSSGAKTVTYSAGANGFAASFVLRFELPELDALNNIGRLVTAICRPVQDLWDVCKQVLLQRSLLTAVGKQLDTLGKLVGQPRDGLDDETYRRYCRANIAAHRSRGTIDELVTIAQLVAFDDALHFEVFPQSVATVLVQAIDKGITDALAEVIYLFLRRAASAGVRIILQYGNVHPVFRLDQSPGLDQGHLGGEISDR